MDFLYYIFRLGLQLTWESASFATMRQRVRASSDPPKIPATVVVQSQLSEVGQNDLFNKAIVCCGGGMYWNSGRLKDIKFRIFHGENDDVVYPEEARRMYARLKEACADVSLTIYPDTNHNCWDKTYSNYDNLKWLFS